MDLVNRLKFFLEKHNIAISQFADTCGIPRPTLSQILNGRNKKISDELISKIHAAYPGLSVMWLMFGEGDMDAVANIKISEPQNAAAVNETGNYNPGYEQITTTDNAITDTSDFSTENSLPLEGLFMNSAQAADGGFSRQEFSNKDIAAAFGASQSAPPASGSMRPGEITQAEDLPEGSISFYPRQMGRQPAKVTSPYISPEELPAPAAATDTENAAATSAPIENTVSDSFVPYTPPEPEPYGTASQGKGGLHIEYGESISVPADPGKRITNIVVFYSDNSFQSFSPS